MTQMENLLRAAIKQTADEVTEDSIPALELAALPAARRSWTRAVGPLLVAAAVALVAVLTVMLSTVLPSHRTATGSADGIPPYYVALTATGTPADTHPVTLTVRSSSTGQVLATVAAPRPYGTFNLVEGTADDRTFLVGAQVWHPSNPTLIDSNLSQSVRLYLLRFDPSTGATSLTALPIPAFSGTYLQAASISPDGTRVAIGYHDTRKTWIRLYTLSSGAARTLSVTPAQQKTGRFALAWDDPATIAWADDDRTISFVWSGQAHGGLHLLNTDVTGADQLLSASRLALPMTEMGISPSGFECSSDPFLSANGQYILCGGYTDALESPQSMKSHPQTRGFAEFSAKTGKLITILDAQRGPMPTITSGGLTATNLAAVPYLLWASPDGKVLIGDVNGQAVVIRDGQTQTIPWSTTITGTELSDIPAIASW